MGFLAKLFKKEAGEAGGGIIEKAGGFALDIRSAITGEMDPATRAELLMKALDLAAGAVQAQAGAIMAEAQGHSWLQRNWRPITMLTFLVLVVLDAFAVLPNPIAEKMWTLLQIGLGGYVVGRSAEKIVDKLKVSK